MDDSGIINILFISLSVLFIIYYLFYFLYLQGMEKRECNNMDSLYSKLNGSLRSVQASDEDCRYSLKDYYIKGAYNCCNGGNYKNDFVDLCILKNILKQGVRGLDFEIFSINNLPCVASSTSSSYFVKETYNQIPFGDIMQTLQNYAFTNSSAPNPTDPIFIHLRIKSTNQKMFQNFADILKKYDSILLGNKYSFEYYGQNLGDIPLLDLCNKIIIIVDKSNTAFLECKEFYEYVNITSNSIFMRDLHYNQIQYNPDVNELTEYNKKYMTFAMPDSGTSSPDNPSSIVIRQTGCQFIAMRYTNFDTNLEENELFFDEKGYAFVLKPENLRFIPVVIDDPKPQNPELSYANREISSNYYNFTI